MEFVNFSYLDFPKAQTPLPAFLTCGPSYKLPVRVEGGINRNSLPRHLLSKHQSQRKAAAAWEIWMKWGKKKKEYYHCLFGLSPLFNILALGRCSGLVLSAGYVEWKPIFLPVKRNLRVLRMVPTEASRVYQPLSNNSLHLVNGYSGTAHHGIFLSW